jgi:hypothetical protein
MSPVMGQVAAFGAGVIIGIALARVYAAWQYRRWRRKREAVMVEPSEFGPGYEMFADPFRPYGRQLSGDELERILAFRPTNAKERL